MNDAEAGRAQLEALQRQEPAAMDILWEKLVRWSGYAVQQRAVAGGAFLQTLGLETEVATRAFFKIMQQGIYDFRGKCTFDGYCRTIVANVLFTLLRKYQRELTHRRGADQPLDDLAEQAAGAPFYIATDLEACLEKLPDTQRTAVVFFYYHQYAPEEIGQAIGIKSNYVHQLLHRARTALRACLERKGYQSPAEVLIAITEP